jgi:hypothetical protein
MTRLAVWVVAVERHAMLGGEASALDVASPITTPALLFASRLVSRAAEAQARNAAQHPPQVFLNVSHPGRADDLSTLQHLQQAGAQLRDATLASLQATLQQLAQPGAIDLLLLYWVGHGVMQGNDRLLVTADSQRADQLWALDLAGLLGHLRDQAHAPLQVGFIEACAQLVSAAPNRLALAQHAGTDRRQHFYFSASATELASDDTRRPGFTQSVLATLQALPWPPEPAALHADLSARLAQLPLASRPATLSWTDGSGDLWSARGDSALQARDRAAREAAARNAGVSVSVLTQLLDSAGGLVDAPTLAQALYLGQPDALLQALQAAHPGSPAPAALHEAWARWQMLQPLMGVVQGLALYWPAWQALAADELARSHGQARLEATDLPGLLLEVLDQGDRARGIGCLLRVLERAARQAPAAQAQALREALRVHPGLQPLLQAALAELPSPLLPLYLSVQLRLAADQHAAVDGAWLTDGDHRQTLQLPPLQPGEGLAAQLNDMIQMQVARAPSRPFVVELLVPTDLLCAPRQLLEFFDEVAGGQEWLEGQWPVVLRWLERMNPKGPQHLYGLAQWLQRAHQLAAELKPEAPLRTRFLEGLDPADLVLLDFPGPAPADQQRNRRDFVSAVKQGHPYMGWPRNPVADAGVFRARALALAQACTLQRLPQALVETRQRQLEDPVLSELWLLIDDPARNPLVTAGPGLVEPDMNP